MIFINLISAFKNLDDIKTTSFPDNVDNIKNSIPIPLFNIGDIEPPKFFKKENIIVSTEKIEDMDLKTFNELFYVTANFGTTSEDNLKPMFTIPNQPVEVVLNKSSNTNGPVWVFDFITPVTEDTKKLNVFHHIIHSRENPEKSLKLPNYIKTYPTQLFTVLL